jgi:hypothetical protein
MRTNKHGHTLMWSLHDVRNVENILSWNKFSVGTDVEGNCILF